MASPIPTDAFAYLEADGVLLCIALAATLSWLVIAAWTVWQAMSTAGWETGIF